MHLASRLKQVNASHRRRERPLIEAGSSGLARVAAEGWNAVRQGEFF
jgi:hypothetical protein